MTQTAPHRAPDTLDTPDAPGRLAPSDPFVARHVAPDEREVKEMLGTLGLSSLDALVDETIPAAIRLRRKMNLPHGRTEHAWATRFTSTKADIGNRQRRSFCSIGPGSR